MRRSPGLKNRPTTVNSSELRGKDGPMRTRISVGRGRLLAVVVAAVASSPRSNAQQLQYLTGQNVVPLFEGWAANPAGALNMVLGYLHRTYREASRVRVG